MPIQPISREVADEDITTAINALIAFVTQNGDLSASELAGGTANGTNKAFTTAHKPIAGTVEVFVNGALQAPSAYAISGNTITFVTAPASAAVVLVTYWFAI